MKKVLILVVMFFILSSTAYATPKTYVLTKDYSALSFDGVVLTPPQSVKRTFWEINKEKPSEEFFNTYPMSDKSKIEYTDYHMIKGMSCPYEAYFYLFSLSQEQTNSNNLITFPAQNAELCNSVGDYSAEEAYTKVKEFLKSYNPNATYYLVWSGGATTDMVNQSTEEIKKDKENEWLIKKGKIGVDHLDFFKTYYQFYFYIAYNNMLVFGDGGISFPSFPQTPEIIVSKDGIEYLSSLSRTIFKEEGEPVEIIPIEQVLERMNMLEEIKSKSKDSFYNRKTYFKAEVGWALVTDDYGNALHKGEAFPVWRLGWLIDHNLDDSHFKITQYDYVDARTGELFNIPFDI